MLLALVQLSCGYIAWLGMFHHFVSFPRVPRGLRGSRDDDDMVLASISPNPHHEW